MTAYLLHHLLRDSAERHGDKEALVHRDTRMGYSALWRAAQGVARGLRDAGIRPGDRVGVLLDPSPALPVALFGIAAAGAVFVPMHHGLFPEQIEHIVRDCGMTCLITDAARWQRLASGLQACESLTRAAITGPVASDDNHAEHAAIHGFDAWCASGQAAPVPHRIGRDLTAILYTSGSTGKPKGVMLSHANLLAGSAIVSEYLGIGPSDRILAALPFSFDAGLNQLLTAIRQGGTCVLIRFLFAHEIVETMAREQVTGLAGVPPLWNLLVQDSSRLQGTPLPALRYVTNTGGALPLPTLQRLRDALPETDVVLMYGLTEAFRSTYLPPAELDRRPTSMGKAIPNTEILVLDDAGQPCAPGEIGELVHRGPTVSMGYWGQPELTAKVLRPNPLPPPGTVGGELVCYSGDLVRTDEDGFLYFVGRRDNQIKSAGFRISPTEVEQALSRSGPLRDAAVIGIPDDALGQRLVACVVPREGSDLDVPALLAGVARLLPRHMVPHVVDVMDDLPKTGSGKIDYPALRRRTLEEAPRHG
jgi:acyl-CoA ligase (AMP-forming) (exosortase A-associated)